MSAAQVSAALAAAPWDTFEIVAGLPEPYAAESAAILGELRRVAQADELTASLAPALRRAQTDSTALIRRATRKPDVVYVPGRDEDKPGIVHPRGPIDQDTPQVVDVAVDRPSGRISVPAGDLDRAVEQLRAFAADQGDATIEVTWRIVP
ncbi:hypothetical protein JNW88_01630 [Micromonospora sp. ATA32]|nr:hypothetical protein [Micromonospora sp. ATA32]